MKKRAIFCLPYGKEFLKRSILILFVLLCSQIYGQVQPSTTLPPVNNYIPFFYSTTPSSSPTIGSTNLFFNYPNMGINTTSPSEKLDLNCPLLLKNIGSAPSVTSNRLYNLSGSLFWNGTALVPTGTNGQFQYFNGTIWTPTSAIFYSGGQIGIGITTPSSPLHVAGALRLGVASSVNGSEIFQNSANSQTVTIGSAVTTASYSLTLPTSQGAGGVTTLLANNGSGNLSFIAPTSLGFANASNFSGTNNYLARWTSSSALGIGTILDNGTVAGVNATSSTSSFNIKVAGTLNPLSITNSSGTNQFIVANGGNVGVGISTPASLFQVAGNVTLGVPSSVSGTEIFQNSSNANTVTINSGATSASYGLTLPTAQGASGATTLLANDGSGNLSFVAPSTLSANVLPTGTSGDFLIKSSSGWTSTGDIFDDAGDIIVGNATSSSLSGGVPLTISQSNPQGLLFQRPSTTVWPDGYRALFGISKPNGNYGGLRLWVSDDYTLYDAMFITAHQGNTAGQLGIGIGAVDPQAQVQIWCNATDPSNGGANNLLVGPYSFGGGVNGAIMASGGGSGFYFADRSWNGLSAGSAGNYFNLFSNNSQAYFATPTVGNIMTFDGPSGNVGIGIDHPAAQVQISNTNFNANISSVVSGSPTATGDLLVGQDNFDGPGLGKIKTSGSNNGFYFSDRSLASTGTTPSTYSSTAGNYYWWYCQETSAHLSTPVKGNIMNITSSGNVGINITPSYTLHVSGSFAVSDPSNSNSIYFKVQPDGTSWCTELTVDVGPFPDYVFSKNYKLKPLSEVERYITEYQHLEGVPAASDVKEKGMKVGAMETKLLEKIEELTRYAIDQQKEIDELKKQNEAISKKLNKGGR